MPTQKKKEYGERLFKLLDQYEKAFLFCADNVGSKQFMDIRAAIRPMGCTILMGKNTLMKLFIRRYCSEKEDETWAILAERLVGNLGVLFVRDDFASLKAKVEEFRRPAAAKAGAVAQCDVQVTKGPTSLDPSQTSFFQALGISTKIQKGTIEILSDLTVVHKGERVPASAAALLGKLNIRPFAYGLELTHVFENGEIYEAAVLDINDDDLAGAVESAIANIAQLSLGANYPTLASVPHSVVNTFKDHVLALGVMLENYSFPLADKAKEILENPEAFAAAAAAAAPTAGGGDGGGKAEDAPAAAEEEEEEEDDMEFSLFD